jgi:bifunctional UDP-N-acetylglucosamine pyrophosphorylase/glucosamine-1-phosphate N-acetyltransferase
MAEAALAIHDRLIRRHEAAGVSFVLPATTWVDADVTIGADTVIYPGAVLEGQTKIGSECVIGPYTRLVDATLGRGVELKGWNYVARTAVRNHAVLEPYVRRGFD